MPVQYRVCHAQEIPPGEKRSFTIKNIPIVVIHSKQDTFYAIYGLCPHQRSPLAAGVLGGLTDAPQPGEAFAYIREGEILPLSLARFQLRCDHGSVPYCR